MIEAYICDAVRTPIGRFEVHCPRYERTTLQPFRLQRFYVQILKLHPREVDDVFLGVQFKPRG